MPPSSTPPVVPVPIWSVPPELRLIAPELPLVRLPPTDTSPPVMVSVPLPDEPTVRLPLLAHVPLDTVALPTLPAVEPIVPLVLVTLPPSTVSVPVP